MAEISGTVAGAEGALFWQAWRPTAQPLSIIVIVHGFDDHGGRYAHVAAALANAGHVVYAFDQIGHGRSEGRRGHVEHFESYVADLSAIITLAKAREGNLPIFLIGHSQGGMVVLLYGLRQTDIIRGIVASGAALVLAMPAPTWKRQAGRLLSRVAPAFTLPHCLPLDRLSREPDVARSRLEDPFRHGRASARWAEEFFAAQADTLANAPLFRHPCLLLHGGDDQIIDPVSTRRFFGAAASSDKTMTVYDGMYHEIFNEIGKEQVIADVERWIRARI